MEPESLHLDIGPLDVLQGPPLQVTLGILVGKLLGQIHPTKSSSKAASTAGITSTSLVKGQKHST